MATFTGEEMDYRQKGSRAPKEGRKEGSLPDTREVAKRALAPRHSQEMAPDDTPPPLAPRHEQEMPPDAQRTPKTRLFYSITEAYPPDVDRLPIGERGFADTKESNDAIREFIDKNLEKGLSEEEILAKLESAETRRALKLKDARPPEDIKSFWP
tara:strand:- start:2081 stop:2545 length:465 start_codon:yes stop_codon:yes gene_type:complete